MCENYNRYTNHFQLTAGRLETSLKAALSRSTAFTKSGCHADFYPHGSLSIWLIKLLYIDFMVYKTALH